MISAHPALASPRYRRAFAAEREHFLELQALGREAAQEWLEVHVKQVGREVSFRLPAPEAEWRVP